jgi:membrane protein YdbS with pleckstrin-like domain
MKEQELRIRWQRWIEKEIEGSSQKKEHVLQAIMAAIKTGKPRDEILVEAQNAARTFARETQSATPLLSEAPHKGSSEPGFRGIYDLVLADKSPLGQSTLAALRAVELHTKLRTKSFISLPSFRGGYGFHGVSKNSLSLILVVLIVIVLSLNSTMLHSGVKAYVPFYIVMALLVLLLLRIFYVLILTPLLARNSKVDIADGRFMITYGVFSTSQIVFELHWIREVGWSQSLLQKILNEGTITIDYDTSNRGVVRQIIPGLVQVSVMQDFVDKLRNASQKLRQGNYYAKSFIG